MTLRGRIVRDEHRLTVYTNLGTALPWVSWGSP